VNLRRKLTWIAVLYFAEGFPFGIAYDVWPVYFRLHGVSLNVSPDMAHFSLIVPCGIRDQGVTSLVRVLGHPVETAEVKAVLRASFERVFELQLYDATRSSLGLQQAAE